MNKEEIIELYYSFIDKKIFTKLEKCSELISFLEKKSSFRHFNFKNILEYKAANLCTTMHIFTFLCLKKDVKDGIINTELGFKIEYLKEFITSKRYLAEYQYAWASIDNEFSVRDIMKHTTKRDSELKINRALPTMATRSSHANRVALLSNRNVIINSNVLPTDRAEPQISMVLFAIIPLVLLLICITTLFNSRLSARKHNNQRLDTCKLDSIPQHILNLRRDIGDQNVQCFHDLEAHFSHTEASHKISF